MRSKQGLALAIGLAAAGWVASSRVRKRGRREDDTAVAPKPERDEHRD